MGSKQPQPPPADLAWEEHKAKLLAESVEITERTEAATALRKAAPRLVGACEFVDQTKFLHAAIAVANTFGNDTDPNSVLTAAMDCARLGLMPGEVHGQAYFVPYRQKPQNGQPRRKRCQLVIGYQGFLRLGYRSGHLDVITAEVLLDGEQASQKIVGGQRVIEHDIPFGNRRPKAWASVKAAYCVYVTKSGRIGGAVVERDELEQVHTGRDVWKSNPVAMSLKTAVRRAAKFWDRNSQIDLAISLDEKIDAQTIEDKRTNATGAITLPEVDQ